MAADAPRHVAFLEETSSALDDVSDQPTLMEDVINGDEEDKEDQCSTTSTEDEDEPKEFPSSARRERKRRSKISQGAGVGLDLEFTRWREAVVVVCLIFYVSDLLLDAWVLRTFINGDHLRQAWFMGFCMLVPNLYAGYKSLQWYLREFEVQERPVKDPKIWLIRVLFFPISLVLRYYHVLRRGHEARLATNQGNKVRQRRVMVKFIEESAEVAMLRLFVIFLEDAPICVLNLLIVLETKPEDIDKVAFSVGVVVAKLSCSITLGVIHYVSLTKVAYHATRYAIAHDHGKQEETERNSTPNIMNIRASRRGLRQKKSGEHSPDDDAAGTVAEFHRRADLSAPAHILLYCWQFSTIGSRLVCYAMFASVLPLWLLLLAAVRWLLNTIYILVDVPNMSLANCAAFGGVYLFTFVSASTDQQYIRLLLYYAVNTIEAASVAAVWWTRKPESEYHVMGFGLLVGGTLVSFIFMVIYYGFGHPNRKETYGWKWCKKRVQKDVESTCL